MPHKPLSLPCTVALCLWGATGALANAAAPPTPQPSKDENPPAELQAAKIEDIGKDQSSLQVRVSEQSYILAVKEPSLKTTLKSFNRGDIVTLSYSQDKAGKVLQDVSVNQEEIGLWPRIIALGVAALVLLLLFSLLLRSRLPDLAVGTDNRYSKSKFQLAIWFFVLLVSYVAVSALRVWAAGLDFIGGVGIPQNLLLLSGFSAFTFAGAKAITKSRVDAATQPAAPGTPTHVVQSNVLAAAQVRVVSSTDAGTQRKIQGAVAPSFPFDLFHDDEGRVALGDFQMVVITLLAVVVYVLTVVNFLGSIEFHKLVTLPDVDGTILSAFGLGQGAYLTNKLVGDSGGGRPTPQAPAAAAPAVAPVPAVPPLD